MLSALEDQDVKVRASVYDVTMAGGLPPTVHELTQRLGMPAAAVRDSLERLAAARALVLQRDSREVLMANPFSAIPTPFAVHARGRLYYGNCIWDALASRPCSKPTHASRAHAAAAAKRCASRSKPGRSGRPPASSISQYRRIAGGKTSSNN